MADNTDPPETVRGQLANTASRPRQVAKRQVTRGNSPKKKKNFFGFIFDIFIFLKHVISHVTGLVIHTNNDVEGWHHRLNQKAKKGQQPFYLLLHLLYEETKWINLQVRLVLEYKLTRHEERRYRKVQSKVLSIWDNYTDSKISTSQLLKSCAKLVHVPE